MIWIELDERDSDDSVSVANKLSDSLEEIYGVRIFGQGVPIAHGVARLLRFHSLLGPYCIAVTAAQWNYPASLALAPLGEVGSNVILVVAEDGPSATPPLKVGRLVGEQSFALRRDEAIELAHGLVSDSTVDHVWRKTEGRLLEFVSEIRAMSGEVPLLVPEPSGFSLSGVELSEIPFEVLISSLRRKGALVDAFEVTTRLQPERSAELIEEAGPQFSVRGLHERLYNLLSGLPTSVLEGSDELMRWFFAAAVSIGEHRSVRPLIERYLFKSEAPELRALYASAFPGPQLVEETERAIRVLETPLTLRLHGFALGQFKQGNEGLEYLLKALRMAEALGDPDQVVATATDTCNFHIRRGNYREAHEWAQWAIQQYVSHSCQDELRKLAATSLLVFTRLLTDQLVGVESLVREIEIPQELTGLPTTETAISTVGDWHFLSGRFEEAIEAYRRNVDGMPRAQLPFFVPDIVPPLVQLGRVEEAVSLGQRVRAMTANSDVVSRALGLLSCGLALSTSDSDNAIEDLEQASTLLASNLESQRLAQATISLAGLHLRAGNTSKAIDALSIGRIGIKQLGYTGWQLAGGVLSASEIRRLWNIFNRSDQALEIEFLGAKRLRLHGASVDVSTRHAECVTILASEEAGLTGERLALALYGDGAVDGTLKALISRLRSTIPIQSRPYRLAVTYQADFLDLLEHLKRGRVRQALNLYKGPLLPTSDAPAVVELREHIDEALRQAVLASGDAEAMIELANRTDAGDLELLETAYDHLPQNDPQSPLLRARIRQIRRDWDAEDVGRRGQRRGAARRPPSE
jgi:tetratricopeptide (TPR) repeat protein